MDDLKTLRDRRNGTWGRMKQLVDEAKAKHRGLTTEERAEYDRLDGELTELDDQVRDAEMVAKVNGSLGTGLQSGGRRDGGTDNVRVADLPEETVRSFGQHLAALSQSRAQSESVDTAGGFAVPTPMANTIIDLVRNAMVTRAAGVQVLNLDSETHRLPKLVEDAQPSWRTENSPIGLDEIVIGSNKFDAKTCAVIVKASLEVVEDAPLLGSTVLHSLQQSAALELDRVTLFGSGVDPQPLGIANTPGVAATNAAGATLTYDHLVADVGALRAANYSPSGIVYAPRSALQLAGLKNGQNDYLSPPPYLADVPRFETAQVPVNEAYTVGTVNEIDGSRVVTGDFKHAILGLRNSIRVIPLRERFIDDGQTGWVLWFRGDVQVVRTAAFRVRTNVGA